MASKPAVYHCEPIGVDGAMEAVSVTYFCSEECRSNIIESPQAKYGQDEDWLDGMVCEWCYKRLLRF